MDTWVFRYLGSVIWGFGDLGISGFGELGIWGFGDLVIWESGDLAIWGYGELEIFGISSSLSLEQRLGAFFFIRGPENAWISTSS